MIQNHIVVQFDYEFFKKKFSFLVSVFFALVGKLTASSCQLLIVVYTTETYPTALRSTGVGLSACIARLFAMIGPQLSATQYSLWFPLPYIVYSLASCLAALAASQLPPIHSPCKLPETVHEVEKQHVQTPPVVSSPPRTLDQRRPSSALIRDLGVVKPNIPPPPPTATVLAFPRSFPRRHSTVLSLGQQANRISRLPTINDMNEEEVCLSMDLFSLILFFFVCRMKIKLVNNMLQQ